MPIFEDPLDIIRPEDFYAKPDPVNLDPFPSDGALDQWMIYGLCRSHRRRNLKHHIPARYQWVILDVVLLLLFWVLVGADHVNTLVP